MQSVLITGITGRSGKWFYQELLQNREISERFKIAFVVRNKQKYLSMLQGDAPVFDHYVADIDDQEQMKEVFKRSGAKVLFHVAGVTHSLELVKTAISCGVTRLVLVHTTGIYSKYKAVGKSYRAAEAQIEQLIKGRDIALTILRPTMVYGSLDDMNISRFIRMVDRFKFFPVVQKGTFALQPVNQRDLGKAYFAALTNLDITANKNYNLSGSTPIDLIDILKNISLYLGKRTYFFSVPLWFAYSGAVAVYFASFKRVDYREKVKRLVEPRTFSHEEARADFGYAPMPFLEGLHQEVEDYIQTKRR
ncbi:hopanoid-associated sugar epimerase [uncultured Clostridium sp.]|nr:hopanoid-associated sugar epimerase [uncultured Clostridium sp.]